MASLIAFTTASLIGLDLFKQGAVGETSTEVDVIAIGVWYQTGTGNCPQSNPLSGGGCSDGTEANGACQGPGNSKTCYWNSTYIRARVTYNRAATSQTGGLEKTKNEAQVKCGTTQGCNIAAGGCVLDGSTNPPTWRCQAVSNTDDNVTPTVPDGNVCTPPGGL
jgi:hypothetical protein